MDNKQGIDQIIQQCLERDEQAYEKLRAEFKEHVANLDNVPEVSRIKELERIWGEINETRRVTTSEAIQALLRDIDEAEVVVSKKESTRKKG